MEEQALSKPATEEIEHEYMLEQELPSEESSLGTDFGNLELNEPAEEFEQIATETDLESDSSLPLAQLEENWPKLYDLEEAQTLIREDSEEKIGELAALREELELEEPEEDPEEDPAAALELEISLLEKQTEELEKAALEIPQHLLQQLEDLQNTNQRLRAQIEASKMQYIEAFTRAQRERFVAEFITKGVKKLLEDLEPTFAKVANGDAAKKLVRSKVTSAISSRAENFIIEGTTPHLSVEAHLEIASYEVGGEITEYVVGVDVRDAQTLGTHVSKD